MDPLESLEGAKGRHMAVEVKCEVHLATTNGLFADRWVCDECGGVGIPGAWRYPYLR
jgi:hypothetical protein